jgi:hypothetical protein
MGRRSEGKLPTRIIGSAADNPSRIGKPEIAWGLVGTSKALASATEEDTMAKKAKKAKAKKAKKARKSK